MVYIFLLNDDTETLHRHYMEDSEKMQNGQGAEQFNRKEKKRMNKGNRAAKKAFALLLSLVMVICMMPQMAFADMADEEPGPQVVTEDGFTIEDGVLTAYNGTDTEVKVPDGVVTIGDGTNAVFGKGSNVTKVTMPDSVTAIAANAFSGNTELLAVEFSDSLTTIGKNAFQDCEKLGNVRFPKSLKSIEQDAFRTCNGLEEIVFPENLETLGKNAFMGCSNLKGTVEIPEKVTSIEVNTFNSAGFTKVILKSENTTIGTIGTMMGAFKKTTPIYYYEGNTGAAAYCKKMGNPSVIMYPIAAGGKYMADLQSFFGEGNLNYTVSVDGGQAEPLEGSICQTPAPEEGQTKDLLFTASDNRTHHILLEGRTYQDFVIEDGVLTAYKGSASAVEIPYGVTTIGDGSGPVFGDTLVDVKLPETIVAIAANAFAETGLKQIEIPKTIETLDVSAFADSALQKLTLSGNTELEGNGLPKSTVVYLYSANTQAKEYCVNNSIRYRVIDDTSADEEIQIIYNGVYKADLETIFGPGAWTYTVSVDGGNDTAIGEDYQLQMPASETTKRIVFSASDGGTFKEHSVRLVVYKDGKSEVAEGGKLTAFNCGDEDTVKIPYGVTELSSTATSPLFGENTKITSVVLPETLESIGSYAFSGCTGLSDINLPASVASIGTGAFRGCAFSEISLPENLKKISSSTFNGCKRLQEIDLSNVESIGVSAFLGCGALKYVTFSENLKTIEKLAFSKCTSLEVLLFYGSFEGVKAEGSSMAGSDGAFSGCTNLKAIYFVDEPGRTNTLSLPKGTFYQCSELAEVLLPENAELGEQAIPEGCKQSYRQAATGSVTDMPITDIYYNGDQEKISVTEGLYQYNIGVMDKKAVFRVVVADGYTLSYRVTKGSEVVKSGENCSGAFEFPMDGTGAYQVTLTAAHEDGDSKTYTVTLNHTDSLPQLKTVSFAAGELRAGGDSFTAGLLVSFDPEKTDYTVRVNGTLEKETVSLTADADADVYVGKGKNGRKLEAEESPGAEKQYTYETSTAETLYLTVCKTEDGTEFQTTYAFKWYKTNANIRQVGSIVEYKPAEGQFIFSTEEELKNSDRLFNGFTSWSNYISLGSFGGYLIIKCDEPIVNSDKNPYGVDFMVYGNAFGYGNGGGGEPAGVQVSQDGKTWYTLAGSAHYETTTLWNETATLLDGSTTQSVLIARNGENGVDGEVPGALTPFGYADVHRCSANSAGDGVYPVENKSDNPYRAEHTSNLGDSFDISWAVDENGQPVYLDSVQYIRIQNVVDIYHDLFGENSTELGAVFAIDSTETDAVGVTEAPTSIKINGKEYSEADFTKAGNTYYLADELEETAPGVKASGINVQVTAADTKDNIYVNNTRYDGIANYSDALDENGEHMVRVIVQNGKKEPVIYVFKMTGGDETDYLLNRLYVKNTGAVFEDLKRIDGLNYELNVKANYEKVDIYPEAENGSVVTVNDTELTKEGYVSVDLNGDGKDTTVKIVVQKDGRTEETTLVIHRAAYDNAVPETGTVTISMEKFVLGQGYIIEPVKVQFNQGDTAADVTKKVLSSSQFQAVNGQYGFYLEAVKDPGRGTPNIPQYVLDALKAANVRVEYTDDTPDWLGEFDYTSTSGWMITVNDYFIDKSAGAWEVKDGDVIRWQFTVYGLGADIGNSSPDASYGGQQSLINLPNKDLLTRLIAEKGAANVPAAVMEIATKLNATADEVSKAVAALQGDSSALEELNQVVSTSGNTTTVQVSGSVSGTTVKAELSKDHGAEMVKQAKDGKVSNVEIKVTTKDNTSSATAVEVVIPTSAVQSLAKDTAANLKVDSSQGSLILDEKALDEIAAKAKGDTVTLRLEQIAKPTDAQLSAVGEGGMLLQASAKSGDMTLGSLGDGKATVRVEVPASLKDKEVAAVSVAADGTVAKLSGKLVISGGKSYYEFTADALETYALVDAAALNLTDQETDEEKAERIKAGVQATTIKLRSTFSKKNNIQLKWTKSKGYKVDYYEVFKSTKRYSGFGTKAYYKTSTGTKNTYINTKELKKGTRYFYKVRGVRTINGEKVYTQWSNKAWRISRVNRK